MTASNHQFGGKWTVEKLQLLREYLDVYMEIFTKNERASFYQTIYVDAFAGTGERSSASKDDEGILPFDILDDEDAKDYGKGSAQIALDTNPPFDKYIFVENKPKHVKELEALAAKYEGLKERINIKHGEANEFLVDWCRETDWKKNRAVVFLDPYGMQVEWKTIVAIAETKAIDLWLLFPLGLGVNRLLMRRGPPKGQWAERLTKFFGTDSWEDAFYTKDLQVQLFDIGSELMKTSSFDSIGKFFVDRLDGIFEKVSPKPLPLFNSRGHPMYLLCFAAGNPKGATTAVKIANHLLKRR